MKKFRYKARDQQGKIITGEIETTSPSAAAKVLLSKSLFPIDIHDAEKVEISLEKVLFISAFEGVSRKKKAVAIRQLSALVNAGLPLTQSLETMAKESDNKRLKEAFTNILHEVEGGSTLANAFAQHPNVFTSLDVSLIQAGEKSGTLDKVLARMANQIEKEARLISSVRTAMIYPTIIITVVIGVVALMVIYVMPKLILLYEDFQGKIPAITQMLMNISNFMSKFWWLILIVIIITILGLREYKKTPAGREIWDSFKLKVPLFKRLIIKIYLARFTRTLGTLIGSGVPVLDALKITSNSIGNIVYKNEFLRITDRVRGGSSLSDAMTESSLFPPVTSQMIKVGEQTGAIDSMLDSLANYYEDEVDNIIKGLSTLIEPIIIIILGFAVAFILIAIMSPIYNISQVIFKK